MEKRVVVADFAESMGSVSSDDDGSGDEIIQETHDEQKPEEHNGLTTARHMVLVGSIFMTLFLPALDQTIVSTALPKIMSSLNAGSSDSGFTWIGSAFALAQAVVLPFFGQLSEAVGRKWTFLAAIVIFMVGSALCGASQSIEMLIASRTIQGVGGGGITSLVFILIGDLVGTRKRGKYQGFIGATWAVASALGPVLGGVFAEKADWRWCFFVNLPICAVCIAIIFVFLQISRPTKTLREAIQALDFAGIFAMGVTTVLLLLSFEWASQGIKWSSGQIIACLVTGSVAFVSFLFAEWRASRPVIPLRFFTHRTRIGGYASCFLHAIAYSGMNYYTPLFFQGVKGQSATRSGVSLLPLVLAFAIVSTGSGYLITATKRYRELVWAGFIIATLGCGLLVLLDENISTAVTAIILIVAGVGFGPNFNSLLIPIHASFDDRSANSDIALSASAYAFIRAIGSSIGISISGLVCFTELRSLHLESISHMSISQAIEALHSMTGVDKEETVHGFQKAMNSVFIEVTVAMGLGMLLSFMIGKHKLGESIRSDHKVGSRRQTEKV